MKDKSTRQILYGLFLVFILVWFKKAGAEQPLSIAVSANFAPVLQQISRDFTKETSIPVQLAVSSSGKIFSLIQNRAPFDLFFSADGERPEKLYNDGACDEPIRYAVGTAVLWSNNKDLCALSNWEEMILQEDAKKIAIANPVTAPYGKAAKQVLMQMEGWPEIEKKLVYGTNVGHAFQYAQSEVAQAAFVSLSFALSEKGSDGCYWRVRESAPVEQKACVVSYSQRSMDAERFLHYSMSVKTASVRNSFGYQ
jgi:molybdate transport system substrate-binding protein